MYQTKLSIRQTQSAIQDLRSYFQDLLKLELNLTRATAPLFVTSESCLNDGLNGEKPVSFLPKNSTKELQIVHSLAKWKRQALHDYDFNLYEGLFTDMNAIRREEELDNIHSYYVDQWDWEKIIDKNDRNIEYLKYTVSKIYNSILLTKKHINEKFKLEAKFNKEVFFISSQELENLYPELTPEEREQKLAKEKGTIFIYQIGWPLKSGYAQSRRAFDYDDWELNGDLIIYAPWLDKAIEISSMGIRVDRDALLKQSNRSVQELTEMSEFHAGILNNVLPLTIGGGIGQSRLCMLILEKHHIGEVQSSYWPEKMKQKLAEQNIHLL
ncbi:aspartate--ammonia ligase [Mycoplasma sp. ES3157-GEN-MYC]|uniref:Aspartate--ammonia ligase n=1 Tax=Mycoplasma miroungigenitalium TaxID=754515 RepID=A0A6M4JFJ2_9MOLU|nr:aspartate--ammonia ligase [Mycoplasma miroungigenitalium]MBU4690379.1 aspartate--ammonia ligase [Mycoplasma miroungigenitalium]MBU4691646.1 aspartate--ammonia ligase [Mycoplasma miroungigenitalium]QJR43471.1 aspartate--ammonia ligase [Mycoplasma miroungigenitalium]